VRVGHRVVEAPSGHGNDDDDEPPGLVDSSDSSEDDEPPPLVDSESSDSSDDEESGPSGSLVVVNVVLPTGPTRDRWFTVDANLFTLKQTIGTISFYQYVRTHDNCNCNLHNYLLARDELTMKASLPTLPTNVCQRFFKHVYGLSSHRLYNLIDASR
jgi:hypothetical protein